MVGQGADAVTAGAVAAVIVAPIAAPVADRILAAASMLAATAIGFAWNVHSGTVPRHAEPVTLAGARNGRGLSRCDTRAAEWLRACRGGRGRRAVAGEHDGPQRRSWVRVRRCIT